MRGHAKWLALMATAALGLTLAAGEKPPESYVKNMKETNAAAQELRKNLDAKDYEGIAKNAAALKTLFATTLSFWEDRKMEDAVGFALLTGHPARIDRLPKDLAAGLPKDLAAKTNVYRDKAPSDWVAEVWERFREALFPLHSAGKLGAVLFQFQFPPDTVLLRLYTAFLFEFQSLVVDAQHGLTLPTAEVEGVAGRGAVSQG